LPSTNCNETLITEISFTYKTKFYCDKFHPAVKTKNYG